MPSGVFPVGGISGRGMMGTSYVSVFEWTFGLEQP